jgi:nucleoside-diphosphate-sugar epimerase
MDAVIHLAGRATFEPYDVVAPTLLDGTRRLAEAAAEAGVSTFVFLSSALVYPSVPGDVTMDTDPDPVIGYGRAKLEAEQALAGVAQTSGMRAVSLRVPHVYGAGSILFSYADRGLIPFVGDMDVTYSHLNVSDAAEALIAAVANEHVSGSFPVSDGTPILWRQFFDHLETFLPSVRVVDLPAAPIQRALEFIEPIRMHRSPTMATPDTVASWRLRQAIDPSKGWSALGIEPAHPKVETGIPAALEESLPEGWRTSLADRRR